MKLRRWIVTFRDMDERGGVLVRERAFTKVGAEAKALLRRPTLFSIADVERA